MTKIEYPDYSHLPPHVLVNILLRLKLVDFKNAVLTCQSWYYASFDSQITRHIIMNGVNDSANIEYISRPIHNIRLNNVNMNKFDFRQLFTNFGTTIVDLDILVSTLAFTRIFEIFAYLPKVQTLRIYLVSNYFSAQNFYGCKALHKHRDRIAKNLGQIKYLTIHSRMRDLTPMKLFLKHCTNVVKLHWNESIYLPHNQFDFICNFLLEPKQNPIITNVTDLLIGCIHPADNNRFFTQLINVALPNLRRLHIKEISPSYSDVTLPEFCKTYKHVEHLTINGCNEPQLHNICKYMHSLKSLRLDKCTAFNNLPDIAKLSQLKSLHLDRIGHIQDVKLIELLSLKLVSLRKFTANHIDQNMLKVICDNCQNLKELHLKQITTDSIEPIFRDLLNLKVLKLDFNMAATCNSKHMDSLDDCNITRLIKLEEVQVNCWLPGLTPKLVQKLPKLQRSSLETTWDPTDEQFASWAAASGIRDERVFYTRPAAVVHPEYELSDFDCLLSLLN